jgi:hypothetical protein
MICSCVVVLFCLQCRLYIHACLVSYAIWPHVRVSYETTSSKQRLLVAFHDPSVLTLGNLLIAIRNGWQCPR